MDSAPALTFDALVKRYRDNLTSFFYKRTRDRGHASLDLETLLRQFENISRN